MCALRSSGTAAATVAAADQVTASARMPPLVFPCRRRAGRRPRTVATVAPPGTSVQSAMRALRSSSTAAATVAAAGRVTASARTLPPVFQSRRRAGRRPPPSRPPPRAESPARAQCTHCAARCRPPPPSRRPPWPPSALEHRPRSSRAVAAMGRPATSGARRPIAEHPARCAARAAHDHRWRPPPSRPQPRHRSAPSTAFSILPAPSHRRAVHRIRAPGQVSHITTGPRASSVFHNQHRCGKRRAADALAMQIHRSVGPDPWICGKPAWHNHRPRSEFSN